MLKLIKLTLLVSSKTTAALKRLADVRGVSKPQIIRDAIVLYEKLDEATREGHKVIVTVEDKEGSRLHKIVFPK